MYDVIVRTTVDLDEDVLSAIKELADIRRTSAGKVLSELARQALSAASAAAPASRNGVPLLAPRPAGAPRPTMRLVHELRDE